MTEQIVEENAIEQQQEIDYKAKYEEAQKAIDALAAKKDELLKETKAAKAERENAKKEAQRIEQEKAMKDGEFEKLWQTAKQEKEELVKQLLERDAATRREKVENYALKISAELSEGDNVHLLSEFVKKSIDKLADEKGSLGDDVLSDIKKEFEQNSIYKSLMKQNHSQGSGAQGNPRGAPKDTKTIERSEFDLMSDTQRRDFLSKGGKLI